jgi:hypothetical protein
MLYPVIVPPVELIFPVALMVPVKVGDANGA